MDMEEAISQAIDVDNFYDLMEAKGYTVSLRSKYPSFLPKGAKRSLRLKHEGRSMTESDIEGAGFCAFRLRRKQADGAGIRI